MKVALAQIDPGLGDPDRNLALHLDAIRRATRALPTVLSES